ncbi:hypothetical protein CapIbe_008329 [Capra ibex]
MRLRLRSRPSRRQGRGLVCPPQRPDELGPPLAWRLTRSWAWTPGSAGCSCTCFPYLYRIKVKFIIRWMLQRKEIIFK